MTSLERLTAALKGGDPDRVPVAMGFSDTRLGTPAQARNYPRWRYRPEGGSRQNPPARARSLRDFERMRFPGEELSRRVPSAGAAEVTDIHERGMAAGGTLPHLGEGGPPHACIAPAFLYPLAA